MLLKNVIDIRLQYISLRTIYSLNTIALYEQALSTLSLPSCQVSNLGAVLYGYTETSEAGVNQLNVLTAAQQADDTLSLAIVRIGSSERISLPNA